ncbi:MAG: hypothetical protein J5816_01030 [Clostridia bacterium]|nr:hypothetical protein [Clostridia bacterium]
MKNSSFDFYIRTKDDLVNAVKTFGFVPLFAGSIPGFSVEEHVAPSVWFDSGSDGVWEWKGPVIRESGCAYGKFFENRAVFISREWFCDFANYRRNGYDFDSKCDEGLVFYRDKELYELIDKNAPVLSKKLKALGNYRRDGKKGFDTSVNRLQAQCYVIISDFKYEKDRYGSTYGWGVAEYSTPEMFMGDFFTSNVYSHTPEQSFDRILTHLKSLLPNAEEEKIRKILK